MSDEGLSAATVAYERGDVDDALALVPALVAADPDDVAPRLLLARCLVARGEPAVALAAAEAAVTCDATSWEARVLFARCALDTDLDGAERAVLEAQRLAPGEDEVIALAATIRTARDAARAAATSGARRARRTGGAGTAPTSASGADPRPTVEPRLPAALVDTGPGATPVDRGSGVTAESQAGWEPVRRSAGGATDPLAGAHQVVAGSGRAEGGQVPEVGDGPSGIRSGLRIVGLAMWLLVGFRMGVQVIGGPVGLALFAGCVAVVVVLARQVRAV